MFDPVGWAAAPENAGVVNLATLAGLIVGLIGFALVFFQAMKAKSAARAASEVNVNAIKAFDEQSRRIAIQKIAASFSHAEDCFSAKRYDRAHREAQYALELIEEARAVAGDEDQQALQRLRKEGSTILDAARREREGSGVIDRSKVDRAFSTIHMTANQLSGRLRKATI